MDQIDEVRSKIDIVELVNQYVPIKKSGRSFKAPCPFHQEKVPSFFVSPDLQIYKCFGCGKGGNIFNFLMEMEGISFGEALRTLAERAGVKLQRYEPTKEEKVKDKLLEINHLTSEFYHFLLTKHSLGKKARDYLLKRGITRSTIKQFKIGYAPDGWRNLFDYLVKKKKYSPDLVEKAGLIIKSNMSHYDRFRGRVTFPLHDHRSRIVGFSGRVFKDDLKSAKYINTPETMLYHKSSVLYGLHYTKSEIKKAKTAIVVEGEFDLLSSFQAGVKNVVAIKGSALTKEQVGLLKRFSENIFLALDADLAGDEAVRRGIKMAEQEGLNVRVIEIKEGKDPDEVASQNPKIWRALVKKATPIYDFYLNSSVGRFGTKSAEGKKRITEEVLPLLAEIENEVVKAHYLKKLAEFLEVNEKIIFQEFLRQERAKIIPEKLEVEQPKKEKLRKEITEEYLLSMLLQSKEDFVGLITISREETLLKYFSMSARNKILEILLKKKKFKIQSFMESLPAQLKDLAGELFLKEFTIDEQREKEFRKLILELKKIILKEELQGLADKMKKLEPLGKEKKIKKLEKDFMEKAKLLRETMVE